MTTREEEMAKLKARYAQNRNSPSTPPSSPILNPLGNKKTEPTAKKSQVIKKPIKQIEILKKETLTPYIRIMTNDIRKFLRLKTLDEIEQEKKYDPLMEAWKRSRNQ